jgi:hypothetical protein
MANQTTLDVSKIRANRKVIDPGASFGKILQD